MEGIPLRMLKLKEVLRRRACGRTLHYQHIKEGLFTPPVKTSLRSSAWPESEVEAIIRARIAGRSDEEVRKLVQRLSEARVADANAKNRY